MRSLDPQMGPSDARCSRARIRTRYARISFERPRQKLASDRSLAIRTPLQGSISVSWIPVSFEGCASVQGPFYYGTRAALSVGDLLTTGHETHFEIGRVLKDLYFAA